MHKDTEINNKAELDPSKWVKHHGDYLYNYAYYRVQSKELSEDLVQDTFISALKAKESFRGESSELTWLLSILKRKVIDHYRKVSAVYIITESEYPLPFKHEGIFEGHWLKNRSPNEWGKNADDELNQNEFKSILELCLSLLPEKWRAVFILKFMEEINSDEICKEIGCSSSNFWVIMHRTRLKLRECLEDKWLK